MNWKEMPLAHKIAVIVSCLAVVLMLACQLEPGFFPIDMTFPAIAIYTVSEAVIYWKKKRKWAYLLIAGTVISLGCFILELAWS